MIDRSLHGDYAGFVSRAVGLAIDVVITVVTVTVVSWFLITVLGLFGIDVMNCPRDAPMTYWRLICQISSISLVMFAALFFPVYLVIFWTLTGETPGMRVMGVRVMRSDGRPVSLWTAIKRLVGYFVCFLTLGLGFLWVLLDDQRQGLHDILAGTVVIYAWNARLRSRFIARMQRTALRAKTTAQVARELGADAWAGKDYHTVVLTLADPAQLPQLCAQLVAWYQQNPPQVLFACTIGKDETGKVRTTEVAEILPPTSAVLASNSTIPRQDDVRGEVFRLMNELPANRSALLAVVDRPLVATLVQVAADADVTVYKGGWAKSKTIVPAEAIVTLDPPVVNPEATHAVPLPSSSQVQPADGTAAPVTTAAPAADRAEPVDDAATKADSFVLTTSEAYDPGI